MLAYQIRRNGDDYCNMVSRSTFFALAIAYSTMILILLCRAPILPNPGFL